MSGINSAKLDNCIVVGNGESRKHIDLNHFKENYTLIGCNALHRDVSPDYLVCCDRRMVEEVVNSCENQDTKILVRDDWHHYYRKIRKNKNVLELPEIPYNAKYRQDEKRNWGSGTYAVLISAQMNFKTISLLGFDLYSSNGRVNNLYKDTANYNNSNSQAIDPSYWIYQIAQTFTLYPEKQFQVINKQDWNMPKEWRLPNVRFKILNEFLLDNKYVGSTISL